MERFIEEFNDTAVLAAGLVIGREYHLDYAHLEEGEGDLEGVRLQMQFVDPLSRHRIIAVLDEPAVLLDRDSEMGEIVQRVAARYGLSEAEARTRLARVGFGREE